MNANKVLLEVQNLNIRFHSGSDQSFHALRDFSLNCHEGEYLIIVGANGSGKSTLLNCIAGNEAVQEGLIRIADQDVSKLDDYERSKYIARLFQNAQHGSAGELTILENLRLAALRTSKKMAKLGINAEFTEKAIEKLKELQLGLENKLKQPVSSLSGGQRQALTLVMAIMTDCKLLLMDEPTAALDPKSAALVMELATKFIKEYNLTAILVTHNMKDAVQYGNRIVQLSEGTLKRDISFEEKGKLHINELFTWFE